ncbi:L-rhamnose mutarotase [Maribacter sp. MAR_2009_72]|uniref:L-rhamnose mutarotase n=1 Tax=Maribacter sp. MAR_2009_72 TaxID=1250050 RepID=UPI00119B88B9|nr:L-rhamnose mutarotase [Maribacter sp. MAR_2009_72]TVZ14778.1 L-rhamnose mutarotase [Maribacter sp. MAR_2009_72]
MITIRHCFICDLKDDPKLIAEYRAYHNEVWPEIIQSIKNAGIVDMEIYLHANRLYMIMEVGKDYDAETKAKNDAENPKVQEWEKLMWQYQQAIPSAKPGQKWVPMERIFKL